LSEFFKIYLICFVLFVVLAFVYIFSEKFEKNLDIKLKLLKTKLFESHIPFKYSIWKIIDFLSVILIVSIQLPIGAILAGLLVFLAGYPIGIILSVIFSGIRNSNNETYQYEDYFF
tara:strand:- start:425 stop:772 length:348 start_codon:yes stop_codon:yes gene_type:complete